VVVTTIKTIKNCC